MYFHLAPYPWCHIYFLWLQTIHFYYLVCIYVICVYFAEKKLTSPLINSTNFVFLIQVDISCILTATVSLLWWRCYTNMLTALY